MQNQTNNFWIFGGWLIAGIVLLALVPGQWRYWLIAIIILGALGYAYQTNPNFAQNIQSIFENKGNG